MTATNITWKAFWIVFDVPNSELQMSRPRMLHSPVEAMEALRRALEKERVIPAPADVGTRRAITDTWALLIWKSARLGSETRGE